MCLSCHPRFIFFFYSIPSIPGQVDARSTPLTWGPIHKRHSGLKELTTRSKSLCSNSMTPSLESNVDYVCTVPRRDHSPSLSLRVHGPLFAHFSQAASRRDKASMGLTREEPSALVASRWPEVRPAQRCSRCLPLVCCFVRPCLTFLCVFGCQGTPERLVTAFSDKVGKVSSLTLLTTVGKKQNC